MWAGRRAGGLVVGACWRACWRAGWFGCMQLVSRASRHIPQHILLVRAARLHINRSERPSLSRHTHVHVEDDEEEEEVDGVQHHANHLRRGQGRGRGGRIHADNYAFICAAAAAKSTAGALFPAHSHAPSPACPRSCVRP